MMRTKIFLAILFCKVVSADSLDEMNLYAVRDLVSGCSLCPDGSSPSNPTEIVTVPFINQNIQCSSLAPLLQSQLNATDQTCQLAQLFYADSCGCPPVNITGTACPGVCLDGSVPSHPLRVLPIDLTGFEQYGLTCLQAHFLAQKLPVQDSLCQLSGKMGQFCGCSNAPTSCTPCYGNSIMPDYSKIINVSGNTTSCGKYALNQVLQSWKNGNFNSATCSNLQQIGSVLCDCPIPPAKSNATCSLCENDAELISNATYSAFGFNASCGDINAIVSNANVDAQDCTDGKAIFAAVLQTCCQSFNSTQTSTAYRQWSWRTADALVGFIIVSWLML